MQKRTKLFKIVLASPYTATEGKNIEIMKKRQNVAFIECATCVL
jgi:hypothetical protein